MTLTLKPYPEYKDSGLPWMRGVPAHWQVRPGLSVYRQKQVRNTGLADSTVLSLSYGKIVVKPPEKLHGLVPASFETYQVVNPGDVIIRPTDLQNDWNSLRVGLARNQGIITSAYLCLEMVGELSSNYGYLLLHAYDLMKIFYGMGSGLRQNLDFTDLKRMPVLVPSSEEQDRISHFVAQIDRRVDRLIGAKSRLIELLNEQKQAIVNQAVTRGIDPSAPLKPSGIDWLGDVPEHWQVRRLRYVFREVDRRTVTGSETRLSMSQRLGLVPSSFIEERRLVSESYIGAKLCEKGDLVLNRLKAHLSVFSVAPQLGIVSQDYTVLRATRPVVPRYYELLLRSPACRGELRRRAKGIVEGFWRLYTDDLYDIALALPPLSEQETIVGVLDGELRQTNTVVEQAYREIDLLREYRTRLISDVVTGKLDVRGVELPALAGDDILADLDEGGQKEQDETDESEGTTVMATSDCGPREA